MNKVELPEGWLVEQIREVRAQVQQWPDVMKPLTTVNPSLAHQPYIAQQKATQPRSSIPDEAKASS